MTTVSDFWPFTDEQRRFQQTTRSFAEKEIRPLVKELDETARFPQEIYKKMVEEDLFGITIPKKWGGVGADTISYAIVMEELSWGYASVADQCGLVELVSTLLSELGTEAQKKRFLPLLLRKRVGALLP